MSHQSKILIKQNIKGNFMSFVGNNIKNYTNEWIKKYNDKIDVIFIDNGDRAIIICKESCDEARFELSAKINYNTDLIATFKLIDKNINYKIIINNNNNRKVLKNHIINEKILKNDEVKIIFNANSKINKGDVIAIIDNFQISTNEYETCEMEYDAFLSKYK
jgi:hypothetical protein